MKFALIEIKSINTVTHFMFIWCCHIKMTKIKMERWQLTFIAWTPFLIYHVCFKVDQIWRENSHLLLMIVYFYNYHYFFKSMNAITYSRMVRVDNISKSFIVTKYVLTFHKILKSHFHCYCTTIVITIYSHNIYDTDTILITSN